MRAARTRLTALAAAGVVAVALHGGTAQAAAPSVRYDADTTVTDAGGTYFPDSTGLGHRGHVEQGSPAGTIRLIAHGAGKAAKFPAGCMATSCRVIIEAADAPDLDPGSGDVTWGAQVLLQPREVTPGANVLQKGFAQGGAGLYKLQADGGKAGCVMVDTGSTNTTVYRATWATSIADGAWHDLVCRRTGSTLTLTVDGTVRKRVAIAADLGVSNSAPLRLGGKNTKTGNDQFFGALDNAFVQRG